jgi:hypothetical protein
MTTTITTISPLRRYMADCAERMEVAHDAHVAAHGAFYAAVAAHQSPDVLSALEAECVAVETTFEDACRLYMQARDAVARYEGFSA